MKVRQYIEIARAYIGTDDPVEQVALAVCHVYGLAPDEVDEMKRAEFLRYSNGMARKMQRNAARPWYYRRIIQTDATKMTLGQFVEVQHWAKDSEPDSMPLIAASMLLKRGNHKKDVARILRMDIRRVRQDVGLFMSSFNDLIASYAGLFEEDEIPIDATEEEVAELMKLKQLTTHPFIERYGWIYSAKQVAEFEGITLDRAYDLPILQALNALSYLKAKTDYSKKRDR
jgi:hypothetical protein